MASIRQEIQVTASAAQAWDAMRDVGALHVRLVPGFVTDTRLEPGARIVWICDLLPNEMRDAIDGMISQGMAAMKRTLDQFGEQED